MGYRVPHKIYLLDFDDVYPGMEVRVRAASIEDFIEISKLNTRSGLLKMSEIFAKMLVSWNLEEEDGTPIPATAEAIRKLDTAMMNNIILNWMHAQMGVAAPLVPRSSDGPNPTEASIPMEALSTSP